MPIKKIIETPLSGVLIIEPAVFPDSRGYFYEAFTEKSYIEILGDSRFVQDNISKSQKGTVRGLHYQAGEFAQGKLCKVLFGNVLDVAVDVRIGSPTYGKYFAQELSDENHLQLWIPPGFAHGFSVLSDEAIFHYKCTAYYSKPHERSIRFNDTDLAIDWMVENPIVSPKDLEAPLFKNVIAEFSFTKK